MRVSIGEFAALLLGQLDEFGINLARHLTALTQYHAPDGIVHHHIAALALFHGQQVHQGDVLRVLRERCHQWGIAHLRPYILYLIEEFHQHVVHRQRGLALLFAQLVDHALDGAQVGHHRAHHATGQTAAEQQRRHVLVGRIDETAQPVVDKLLCQASRLHVCVHIDISHLEALVLQHRLHRDDVGVHFTP